MTTDIATLAVAIDTSQAAQGAGNLDKFAAAGGRAEVAAGKLGKSQGDAAKQAGLNAFQTQQLSYQLNDFFVQIAAGGSPLTALVQQGSQLNGTFGGLQGTVGALTGLINPFRLAIGGAAAAVGALTLAYVQGAREQDAYAKAIILTGNGAGVTTGQLNEMAKAVGGNVATQGKAAEVLAQLAASANVGGAQMEQLTEASLRFERAGGAAVEATVKQFVALGGSPLQAAIKLNDTTNFLTRSLYDQIKALDAQGRTADAAAIAQTAYANTIKSRSAELEGGLGLLERAWRSVGEGASWAWDQMLKVGRAGTVQEQLAAAQKQLAEMPEARRGTNGLQGDARRDAIRQRIADLQMQVYAEGEVAAAQQASAEGVKRYIDEQEKAKKKVESEYDKELKSLRERLALVGLNREADQVAAQIVLGKYGKLNIEQQASLLALAGELDLRKESARLLLEEGKAREGASRIAQTALTTSLAETSRLIESNTALRNEIELLGADENAKAAIEVARTSSARAILEERAAMLSLVDGNEAELQSLRQQIELLRQREGLLTQRQDRKNFLEPVKDLPKDAANETYTSVRDALANAFRDTKNPVKAFAEGLGNAIFSRVTSRLADAMANQLVGSSGSGGLFGSVLRGIGSFLSGGVPVGDGTGATGDFARFDRGLATGTNYVPYDGMKATLHEGEAVIPKRYNPAAGGSATGGARVTFSPTTIIRVDSRTDQAQVQQIAAAAAARANQQQLQQLHNMGVL